MNFHALYFGIAAVYFVFPKTAFLLTFGFLAYIFIRSQKRFRIASSHVKEIVSPVTLCLTNGSINPAAVGYTRGPNVIYPVLPLNRWGRRKRWEYWGCMGPTAFVGITMSNLDYAGYISVYVYDRVTRKEYNAESVAPFGRGIVLPDRVPPVHAIANSGDLQIECKDNSDGTVAISVDGKGKSPIRVNLQVMKGSDALGVVVPWSNTLFQYTVKDVARKVQGTVTAGGHTHALNTHDSWAVLDRGRGCWPYSIWWNWGAGSGEENGVHIGLQLGGKWTDGTGSTECAVFVNGVMEYLGDEWNPVWEYDVKDPTKPWRVRHPIGAKYDVTLTPFHVRYGTTDMKVLSSTVWQAFGTWKGFVTLKNGARVEFSNLIGWAEEAR
eukprot:PhF_6_TR5651/c0_g1_i3/m.8261